MRKRLLLATGAMAGLVCVGLLVALILPRGPGITKVNFDRVSAGMTVDQIEVIFGSKPVRVFSLLAHPEEEYCLCWSGKKGGATIGFDRDGRLVSKEWHARRVPSVGERLSEWLFPGPPIGLPPGATLPPPPLPD